MEFARDPSTPRDEPVSRYLDRLPARQRQYGAAILGRVEDAGIFLPSSNGMWPARSAAILVAPAVSGFLLFMSGVLLFYLVQADVLGIRAVSGKSRILSKQRYSIFSSAVISAAFSCA
ncbi:hypothetical protein [Burkholderia sp. BCC1644]|uniref:hypothetical protein n=1 Tax=Burkholderia sp. BCC1644 TaxID=2676293 RepID=UPI00158FAFC6|nr:hypothetical protein [Burkholderia sp. BCC1644]